jgi:hypothetical protein
MHITPTINGDAPAYVQANFGTLALAVQLTITNLIGGDRLKIEYAGWFLDELEKPGFDFNNPPLIGKSDVAREEETAFWGILHVLCHTPLTAYQALLHAMDEDEAESYFGDHDGLYVLPAEEPGTASASYLPHAKLGYSPFLGVFALNLRLPVGCIPGDEYHAANALATA